MLLGRQPLCHHHTHISALFISTSQAKKSSRPIPLCLSHYPEPMTPIRPPSPGLSSPKSFVHSAGTQLMTPPNLPALGPVVLNVHSQQNSRCSSSSLDLPFTKTQLSLEDSATSAVCSKVALLFPKLHVSLARRWRRHPSSHVQAFISPTSLIKAHQPLEAHTTRLDHQPSQK